MNEEERLELEELERQMEEYLNNNDKQVFCFECKVQSRFLGNKYNHSELCPRCKYEQTKNLKRILGDDYKIKYGLK